MILVGENIHIISKSVREILEKRDENAIKELISMQQNMDYIDLNVGPAKNKLANILPWLADIVQENSNLKISFDTTNSDEMQKGLAQYKNSSKAFINSTSKDEPRLDKMTDLAVEYNCNLIALTLSKETGIPKTGNSI